MTRRQLYQDVMLTLLASEPDGTLDAHSRNRAMRAASELIKRHGALVDVLEKIRDADYRGNRPESARIAGEAIEKDERP